MSSHQVWGVLMKVPLRSRHHQHILSIQAHLIEYERELIHQGDIDILLDVLNDFGRLCGLNILGNINMSYKSAQLSQEAGALLIHP